MYICMDILCVCTYVYVWVYVCMLQMEKQFVTIKASKKDMFVFQFIAFLQWKTDVFCLSEIQIKSTSLHMEKKNFQVIFSSNIFLKFSKDANKKSLLI